jgi:hypothetical protein
MVSLLFGTIGPRTRTRERVTNAALAACSIQEEFALNMLTDLRVFTEFIFRRHVRYGSHVSATRQQPGSRQRRLISAASLSLVRQSSDRHALHRISVRKNEAGGPHLYLGFRRMPPRPGDAKPEAPRLCSRVVPWAGRLAFLFVKGWGCLKT